MYEDEDEDSIAGIGTILAREPTLNGCLEPEGKGTRRL